MTREHQNWKTTISQLKADRIRLVSILARWQDDGLPVAYFHPSFVCVVLYRVSHQFSVNGHSFLARLVAQINGLLTGADISPASDIDEGFVILSPAGISIYGKAGRNFTVMPCAGLGGELGRHDDVGAGPGLPVLGADVTLEPHGGVLGPVRVGNRVRIGAGVLLTRNTSDDTVVEGPRPRILARKHSL